MFRRFIALCIASVLISLPSLVTTTAAQGVDPVTVSFVCTFEGRGNLSATNNSDGEIRISVFARTASSNSLAGSITLAPGESSETQIVATVSPEYGWSVVAERTTAPGGVVWSGLFVEGICSSGDGPAPTQIPTTVVPTATTAPATEIPVANSFVLVSAQRMCADQSFVATWSGANIETLEFSITNTSDEWTSGWVAADPAANTFTMDVDHHNYDKAAARAVFEDGSTAEQYMDIGNCTESPAPPANRSTAVTSLPSTGAGTSANSLIAITALTLVASIGIVSGALRRKH